MSGESRLLARAGVILLTASLLNGFMIHAMRHDRQALSAHLVGLMGSGFLIVLSCLWPHLNQTPLRSKIAALLAVYGFGMGWLVNLFAAVTGNFGVFPLSVGAPRGHQLGNIIVTGGLISVAATLLGLCGFVFIGLAKGNDAVRPTIPPPGS